METRKLPVVKSRNIGPEERIFDELRGKSILISWKSGDEATRAILGWVDVYTIGVKTDDGTRVMIYKNSIQAIKAAKSEELVKPQA